MSICCELNELQKTEIWSKHLTRALKRNLFIDHQCHSFLWSKDPSSWTVKLHFGVRVRFFDWTLDCIIYKYVKCFFFDNLILKGSLPEKPVVRRPWPVKYWQDHLKFLKYWLRRKYCGWLNFVGYQFSWRIPSTNFSANKIAIFCMNYEGKYYDHEFLNPTNVWFLFNPRKLVPTKIKPSTVSQILLVGPLVWKVLLEDWEGEEDNEAKVP